MRIEELKVGDEITYKGSQPAGSSCLKTGKTYVVQEVFENEIVIHCDEPKFGKNHYVRQASLEYFSRFIQKQGGWIGVDLDGTWAVYDKWRGPYHIGPAIPAMTARIKGWLAAGRDVRIFTARVTDREFNNDGTPHDMDKVIAVISAFSIEQVGVALPITNIKDWDMMELWDDRCVQVRPNTGVTLADELEAIKNAEATPKYDGGTNASQ